MSRLSFDAGPLLRLCEYPALLSRTNVATRNQHGAFDRIHADGPASAAEIAALLGVSTRTVVRWRGGASIRIDVADRCALALGLHPALIWPDYWTEHAA